MEDESTASTAEATPPTADTQSTEDVSANETNSEINCLAENIANINIQDASDNKDDCDINKESDKKDESVIVENSNGDSASPTPILKESFVEPEPCETNDDARSLGDLDSLPVGDELVLGAAGSDSGVEGCGRALSSGGGSRSCASSVVSCGSGCGSESSSLAGAPPRPRRRVNVNVTDQKRSSPVSSAAPRPVTAPRGPNLATRERARSREKPTPPEKPRPLTPKPRIRPTADLPNLVRESPALRAKPTKTSTARCRTPNSPSEEKRWPSNGPRLTMVADTNAARVTADKYATLPRRRRDADSEGSPRHEGTPPTSRRPTVTRSASSRTTIKTRVRIYAEKTSQTVLLGTDIEAALEGIVPNIENRIEVSRCHRGVQASARDVEAARLASALAAAAEERERRQHAEAQLAAERAARLAAIAELDRNSQRLLELAGAGAGAGADGCLRALEEQLRSAGELAAKQRSEIDALRDQCNRLHVESCSAREAARLAEARLSEAEREAAEMHDFLAAETGALSDSLRDAETELARVNADLDRRRAECRQLVRMCEQRRQEALAAAASARGRGGGSAGSAAGTRGLYALDALAHRLNRLTRAVHLAYRLPQDALEPTVYHNDLYSRSDSGEALSPEEEVIGGGVVASVARALRSAQVIAPTAPLREDDRSHVSDDNDNSADLLDSETEPCLVTDPECAEEWWSGAEGAGAWSGDELSPERDFYLDDKDGESASASERESLRTLSAAIAQRQRSEAEAEAGDALDAERGAVLSRALALDARLSRLLHALRLAASTAAARGDSDSTRLAAALRDKIDLTEKNVADVVVKKLAELDASKNMMEQYRQSVENLKKQLAQTGDEDDLEIVEEEVLACTETERRAAYEALDAALSALGAAPSRPARLTALRAGLERLAFVLASPPSPAPTTTCVTPLHGAA